MTKFQRTILTATAALTLAALLTGCSIAAGDVAGLIPGAAPAPASAAPTPTVIPGDRDGNGKISAFETEQLAKNALRDYTMPDGGVVTIDPTQPLPEPVVEAVKAQAAPTVAAVGATLNQQYALVDLQNEADSTQDATGKGVIFVYPCKSATDLQGGYENVWATAASRIRATGIAAVQSKDIVLSDAQFWASSRGYEVIVFG
ncbi:hypothetical protein [Cryobacterium sp. Sr3]|uniref:hypothetical protein n=1 Tax=Cryobacterium sp. Sr3 TaxID=1259194 RepID=UPI00106BF89B|nr:hypothetical protein [Cryobacterium sp. Sr3]TFB59923.1 hypothetical protein E3N94_02760 [Cryobacterium sp. Sr3]